MKHLTVIRVLASLPLLLIGSQHLIGTAPILPILVGSRLPLPDVLAAIVPVLQVLSGLALLIGFYARIGALIAMLTMTGAVYAHLVHDWADEPILLLPVAVFVGAAQILWGGAGAFSGDLATA